MVFIRSRSSWTEKKLRKQIETQIKRRRRGKSIFKQLLLLLLSLLLLLLLIVITLFTVSFLYSNLTKEEDSTSSSAINRPSDSKKPKVLPPSQQDYVSVSSTVKEKPLAPIVEIKPKDKDIRNTNIYSLPFDSQELKNLESVYQKHLDSINPVANNVSVHE